jgi:UDP-glucose 4-epimerase
MQRLLNRTNKANYEVFNIGTGKGSSVMEVIQSFERVSGKKLNYKIAPRRDGDVIQAYADTAKSNKELGWKAELSLDDAMLSAWKWQKSL